MVKVISATTPGVSINSRLTIAGLPTLDATKIRYAGQSLGTFSGNTFVVWRADGTIVIEGTFALDPTREPKTVDWTDTFGTDAGKTFPAIYALDGDQLIFCAGDEGRRPTEFRTGKGEVLRIHQRETP